jgi:hypothetical protein
MMVSDLTDILQLQAHLMARPEGAYRDRNGQPCRHPGGLYSQSLGKILSCMRKLTDTIEPDVQPDVRRKEGWPAATSALEALFLAIDSHAVTSKRSSCLQQRFPQRNLRGHVTLLMKSSMS